MSFQLLQMIILKIFGILTNQKLIKHHQIKKENNTEVSQEEEATVTDIYKLQSQENIDLIKLDTNLASKHSDFWII